MPGDPGVVIASLLRIRTQDIGLDVAPAVAAGEGGADTGVGTGLGGARLVMLVPVAGLQYCVQRGLVPPELLQPQGIVVTPVLVTQVRWRLTCSPPPPPSSPLLPPPPPSSPSSTSSTSSTSPPPSPPA